MLTQKELKKLLHYNPETGIFTWLRRSEDMFKGAAPTRTANAWNIRFAGTRAGSVGVHGYQQITVLGKNYRVQRLAWLYVYGEFPQAEIDNEDRDKINNCITNLRDVSGAVNSKNCSLPTHNTSGFVGVGWLARMGKWAAKIKVNGKQLHLGTFTNKEDAVEARKVANIKYGFHLNHGKKAPPPRENAFNSDFAVSTRKRFKPSNLLANANERV